MYVESGKNGVYDLVANNRDTEVVVVTDTKRCGGNKGWR